MTSATHRPTVPGAVLAMAAGALAVALLVTGGTQWRALGVELAGFAFLAGGYGAWRRRLLAPGGLLALVGAALVAGGIGVALVRPTEMVDRLELVPGTVGLAVLFAGLWPSRTGVQRALVTAGTALLFVGVVASGVVRGASLPELLLATVATVLAWDSAEQAVSLGRQVGRRASTARAELTHAGGTVLVGVVVVVAALVGGALWYRNRS